jgi:hypothetical protein
MSALNGHHDFRDLDFRLALLQRAAARLYRVEAGEMSVDGAFDDLVSCLQCSCSREMVERWERDYPPPVKRGRR